MKPPPLLFGVALAFWGWQSDFLIPGLLMGLIVESVRIVPSRWEFTETDFQRVWAFCSLLFLAAGVYAFNDNNGPTNLGRWFQQPNFRTQGGVGLSAGHTATAVFRWSPMLFFPFLAAQLFSVRGSIPPAVISFLIRRLQRRAKETGSPIPFSRDVDVTWACCLGTLAAASVHPGENNTFFWGLAGLLGWILWALRSRRFSPVVWLLSLGVAVGLGFAGQRGYTFLQHYLENLNAEWIARFMRRNLDPDRTSTALGQVGNLKTSGRIIIRLTPHPGTPTPTYLREASYRTYYLGRSPAWLAGSSKNDYSSVIEDPPENSGNWTVIPRKPNSQAVNISCYLNGYRSNPAGLLPVPAGVGRFENLRAYVLSYNSTGAILAEGPGLLIFDALYGPGATLDKPPGWGNSNAVQTAEVSSSNKAGLTNEMPGDVNEDLQVPVQEQGALDKLIDEFQLRDLPQSQLLGRIAGLFADKFSYRTWQPPGKLGTNETALGRFLLKTRAGHCEYFATATTLLLRQLKVPTRYAVGYAVHETSGSGYVVRLRDAHAWCLVWNDARQVWEDFDTTPASWVEEERKHASAFEWLSDAWTRLGFEFAKFRWGQSHLRDYLLYATIPGLAVLLWQIIFRRGRRQQKAGQAQQVETVDWPGLDSEFYRLERILADRGLPRGNSQPLSAWLARLATTPGFVELGEPFRQILRLHYRYRFDPEGLSQADRETLRREVLECLNSLTSREEPHRDDESRH